MTSRSFVLLAIHRLPDGSIHAKPLLQTNAKSEYDLACLAVIKAAHTRKTKGAENGLARPVVVKSIFDPTKARASMDAGRIKVIPSARTVYPSAGHLAETLGLSAASIRQLFYRKRQELGVDGVIHLFGLAVAYVTPDADKVSV